MINNGIKSWNENNKIQCIISITINDNERKQNFNTDNKDKISNTNNNCDNEEIIYNDDYNNTKNKMFERGVKAKILRIKDDDTSICSSEIDVLENVKLSQKKNEKINNVNSYNIDNNEFLNNNYYLNNYRKMINNEENKKKLFGVFLNNTKIVPNSNSSEDNRKNVEEKLVTNNSNKNHQNFYNNRYPLDSQSKNNY